jgi:hypothetical protein
MYGTKRSLATERKSAGFRPEFPEEGKLSLSTQRRTIIVDSICSSCSSIRFRPAVLAARRAVFFWPRAVSEQQKGAPPAEKGCPFDERPTRSQRPVRRSCLRVKMSFRRLRSLGCAHQPTKEPCGCHFSPLERLEARLEKLQFRSAEPHGLFCRLLQQSSRFQTSPHRRSAGVLHVCVVLCPKGKLYFQIATGHSAPKVD